MSTKTAKVLHVIAFILILLTMIFMVVGWLLFKNELLSLVHASPELLEAEAAPWALIIEVGFVLVLALIWLLVLLNRPGRGTTIAMTVILSILLIGYFAVGRPFLNVWDQQRAAATGPVSLAALAQLKYVLSTIGNFAFVPGVFFMILSLGSACGKNFKEQAEEEPEQEVQQPYVQRPNVQQPGMQRPPYGQQPAYPQQGYGQQPMMQNTGYIPKVDAMQNTGYVPKVDAMQNTGYVPKVDAMQNTGFVPKAEAPVQNVETVPAKPAQAETAAAPVIYPWMKAAGAPAPKEEAPEIQTPEIVLPEIEISEADPEPEALSTAEESEN